MPVFGNDEWYDKLLKLNETFRMTQITIDNSNMENRVKVQNQNRERNSLLMVIQVFIFLKIFKSRFNHNENG